MAVNTERLFKLLEHYRDRVHSLGDEGYDEEIDYLQQILVSPIFQQFVMGGSSNEDMTKIVEASNLVLSGITVGSAEDKQLSPTEKRRRQVARRQSLKALRNAVTPKNSPVLKRKVLRSNAMDDSTASPDMADGGGKSRVVENGAPPSSLLQARSKDVPILPKLVDPRAVSPPAVNGIQPHPLSPEKGKMRPSNLSNGVNPTLLETRTRNLSSSTSTLIERPSPPTDYHFMRKKSSDSVLSNGMVLGSQPNIHSLGIKLDFGDLEPFHHPPTVITSPSSKPVPAWNPHHHLQAGVNLNTSHPSPGNPSPLRLPPSYLSHQQQVEPPELDATPLRPPPPYGYSPLMPQRRAKSYDKLLDSPDSVVTYPPLSVFRPLAPPMTDGAVTQDLPTMHSHKTRMVICLEKGDDGLGFRVKGLKNEQRGELGLLVQDLQPGGLAERDGRLKRSDQIISINGHSLEGVPHVDAVKLLRMQSVRGRVELVVVRDQLSSHPPPSPLTQSPTKSPHLRQQWQPSPPTQSQVQKSMNGDEEESEETDAEAAKVEEEEEEEEEEVGEKGGQHKIETIELPNEGQGFGFGVIPRGDGRGTKVHSIVPRGIADKDGRLHQEDQLLQINEESVIHMRYEDVVAKLRSVSLAGKSIRLVVARVMNSRVEEELGVPPEINDSSDEEEFEVELHKNRGLGITIAGLINTDTEEEVSGIYITSLNSTGAAATDGRIHVGDRIVRVDGHPLRGLENMEAAAVLRNSGNPVKLVLGRRKRGNTSPPAAAPPVESEPPEAQSHEQSHDQAGLHDNSSTTQENVERNVNPVIVTSEAEDKVMTDGYSNGVAMLSLEDEQELVEKWSKILGSEYTVKVDQVTRSDEGGLGIRMESTAELDEVGNPQIGSIHHVIQYVHAEGPVGQHGVLQEGDEILEVNGTVLVGLHHDDAIEVVKDTPTHVTIVVCKPLPGEEVPESQLTGSETTDGGAPSESDGHRSSTPDSIQTLPIPGLGDFVRRFERQSWRERHEEERRRLKQRFEQRREEYERHIREQEEELLQQEQELKDRQLKQQERRKLDAEQKRNSTHFEFDYSPYHATPNTGFLPPLHVQSPDSAQESFATDATDSSASILSPVPGSGFWELEVSEIDLVKGDEGLGFSILDFVDPHHPGDRVILVHSLVEGGIAERDNRLKVGDKLLSVNGTSVVNHSLQFGVQQLLMIPLGGVARLDVNHPLPASPEINSSPNSPLSFFTGTRSMVEDTAHDHSTLQQNDAPLGSTDIEEKPISDERDLERGEREREEDEEASHWKKKKSSDSDDEPPPPYSKTDPQEDKFEGEGGNGGPLQSADPDQPPCTQEARKLTTESSSTSDSESRSAASLSRVSSPTRGRTLSDLTRITPEDVQQQDSESQLESLSDTTLVNSQELGAANLPPPVHEVGDLRSGQPKLVLDSQDDGKRVKRKGKKPQSSQTREVVERQAASLVLSYVQSQATVSSQESGLEGLSPEMSDYGEHSNDAESESREIKIRKGNLSLGMNLTSDDKNACIVVKNVASNGAVGRDGRIRVGDRIVTINGKSLDGVSLAKAKSVLKRASSKGEELTIMYVPAPQVQSSYTMPQYNSKQMMMNPPGSASSVGPYPSLQHHLATLRGAPLHDIAEQEGAAMSGGAQANIQVAPHPMMPPMPHGSPLIHQATQPAPQWQQGMSPYQPSPPGATNINPMAPMQATGSYLEQATALGQPPPPYIYLHQPQPGMMAQPPGQPPYAQPPPPQPPGQPPYAQPPPPQPMAWNMQRQAPIQMPPPLSQPSPMASWQMNVIHREPPQYNELIVQQQMIQASQYQMPAAMHQQQSPSQHQMQQNTRMNKSLSETKFRSGMTQRPQIERRHNSQGTPRRSHPPAYKQFRIRQQQQPVQGNQGNMHLEDTFEEQQQQLWPHEPSPRAMLDGMRSRDNEMGRTRLVELVKDSTGSLGIHIGQLGEEGTPSGVVVVNVSPVCQAATMGKLNRGDQILEVNGIDLRHATQAEAAKILSLATSPVRVLLQNLSERLRSSKFPTSLALEESPEHSHHNSWAIEEEEDAQLREEFPDVDGHLYEVKLNKGKSGLGLSIVANTNTQSVKGIVIMGIQAGGVADQSGRIKWGDMILKVNDTCVIGMSQLQVQELLAKAPPLVRFVLVRQHNVMNTQPTVDKHAPVGSDISLEGLAKVKAVQLRRDNDKGLGFTVSEGEKGGSMSVVIITSIIPGGPAEQDGELQVGDQVLSVDGQNILGYSYEKAKHLLQQARSRGSVSLIVASHSSQYEGGGPKGGGEVQGRLPEGVVLRTKKKGSSLKTSRRRPVSVDYDPSLQLPRGTQGKGGGAQLPNVAQDEYKRFSNRNSHPLSEREVEQGFHHFDRQKDLIPGKECEIVIFKGPQMLGVIIVGGSETSINGIYVQKVVPDSPAAKDGRLQPGDRILKVNNASMEDATREDALRALQHSSSFIHLTVLRDPAREPNMTRSDDFSSPSPSPMDQMVEVVELMKPERAGLGLLIWEQGDPGVYVKEVVKNGAAYNNMRIQPGDKILAINGQDISNAGQSIVYQMLQSCKGKVTLTICHPMGLSPPTLPPNQMDFNQPDIEIEGPQPRHMFQSRPPPPYGSANVDRVPPPYSSSSPSQVPITLLRPTPVYGGSPDYVSQHHQHLHHQGPGGMYRGERKAPSPPMQEDTDAEEIQVIRLHRGPSGLGFTIVGGKGSPHGDLPIFIKRVFNEGAAGRDGRLQMGDQLLAVNGISFEDVTHQFAAETLKYLQGDVELTVLSTD